MPGQTETTAKTDLFKQQVARLLQAHFLVLYWCTLCEGRGVKYNITNCFDDLKSSGITRTKQTAVALVETLLYLGFVELRDERNRKNIYITTWGGRALQDLIIKKKFEIRESSFINGLDA